MSHLDKSAHDNDESNVKEQLQQDEQYLADVQQDCPPDFEARIGYELYIGRSDLTMYEEFFSAVTFTRIDALRILHYKFITQNGYASMYSKLINKCGNEYKIVKLSQKEIDGNSPETEIKNVLKKCNAKFGCDIQLFERVVTIYQPIFQ